MGKLVGRSDRPTTLVAVLLVAFAVLLGCAIAAGELLELAQRPGGSTGIDGSITSWMVAHRTHELTQLARALSTLGSQAVLLPVTAIVAAWLLVRRQFVATGLLVAAWGGAILLYSLTKAIVNRPRPPAELWLTDVGKSSSFPSGHATQSLATFLALALVGVIWLPRARAPGRAVALILAAGVGWSRVYLGVHWATDVGAGWLIAAAWVAIVAWLARAAVLTPMDDPQPPNAAEII